MTLVVDASVAVKWFVPEDLEDEADALAGRADLCAPDLIFSEVGNALWGRAARGLITRTDADRGLEALEAVDLTVVESPPLARRALAIACALDRPIYDCVYLACAERLGAPLVTADSRLLRKVSGSPWAPLLRHLGEFGAA
jgi:predicted nucleic acid-binding protein